MRPVAVRKRRWSRRPERDTADARPLLLSGDCPAGLAVAAGLQERYPEIAVVWLDAHGDFNTPAITISGYLGGMALAMLTGHGALGARLTWTPAGTPG